MDTKSEVRRITDEIGSETLQAALGVSEYSIRHARSTGKFPASWFAVMREICRDAGSECSEELFNFKAPNEQPARAS